MAALTFAALHAAQFGEAPSGSRVSAAVVKNGATDPIPALDWAQRHGLPSCNVKNTRNSGRIRGAACNDQIKQECITVFHGQ
jgi:hypothetical protein